MKSREEIASEIRQVIDSNKNTIVSGEEGVGKIRHTVAALQEKNDVYYIGNPFDYEGKRRPQGYEKYVQEIMSLKRDMYVIANEIEILSINPSSLTGTPPILVVDEIYGRSPRQCDKLVQLLDNQNVKVVMITGCLKNAGKVIEYFDAAIMLTNDGLLQIERDFFIKLCMLIHPESAPDF